LNKWLRNREFIGGLGLVIFSIWFYFTSQEIPDGSVSGMPPSFFPTFLAICLGICSFFVLVKGVIEVLQDKSTTYEIKDHRTVLIVICILIIYLVLFNIIGFIASTILYLTGVMYLLKAGKLIKIFPVSVVITLGVYWIFGHLFNIPLS